MIRGKRAVKPAVIDKRQLGLLLVSSCDEQHNSRILSTQQQRLLCYIFQLGQRVTRGSPAASPLTLIKSVGCGVAVSAFLRLSSTASPFRGRVLSSNAEPFASPSMILRALQTHADRRVQHYPSDDHGRTAFGRPTIWSNPPFQQKYILKFLNLNLCNYFFMCRRKIVHVKHRARVLLHVNRISTWQAGKPRAQLSVVLL